MLTSTVVGWGASVPARELSTAELGASLGISEEWIVARTGISARHIAGPETTSTLAAAAARDALARAALDPHDLDAVIVATVTSDYRFPATASLVQSAIGADRAAAFDLNAACAGFLYALAQADALIRSETARRVLVCGADVMSRITDFSDPKTCVLFGDGAGAVIAEGHPGGSGIGPFVLRSDGSRPELLCVPPDTGVVSMNGREIYRRAVDAMASAIIDVLGEAGLSVDDVDLVIAHQANARILEAVASRLGMAVKKFVVNIARYGNTSAASIPLALADAAAEGRLDDGDVVVLAAFGAGLAWGAGLLTWSAPVEGNRSAPEWERAGV